MNNIQRLAYEQCAAFITDNYGVRIEQINRMSVMYDGNSFDAQDHWSELEFESIFGPMFQY